jgi:hypothetical protein
MKKLFGLTSALLMIGAASAYADSVILGISPGSQYCETGLPPDESHCGGSGSSPQRLEIPLEVKESYQDYQKLKGQAQIPMYFHVDGATVQQSGLVQIEKTVSSGKANYVVAFGLTDNESFERPAMTVVYTSDLMDVAKAVHRTAPRQLGRNKYTLEMHVGPYLQ